MSHQFPQYRTYTNRKSWFQIDSEEQFTELQLIGAKYQLISVKANIYPERLFIQDMLENKDDRWEMVTAEEWEVALAEARKHLTRIG